MHKASQIESCLLDELLDSHSYLHFGTQFFMGSEVNYAMHELTDERAVFFNSACALECYHSHLANGISVCEIACGAARCFRLLVSTGRRPVVTLT